MKISVITVAFNAAQTIGATFQSVAAQTYPEIEHIVVDGASTDGTLALVAQYGAGRKIQLLSEPDKGIYDAMNKGISLASGEVVGFINADDFYASDQVLARVAANFADPDVDVCYGDLCYVKQDDITATVRYWRSSGFRAQAFGRGWCPPHPTLFARREIYERFGLFDLNYTIAADVELMMRFFEVHKVRARYIPEILVKMRLGGTTNRSVANIFKQNCEIWRALKAHNLKPSLAAFFVGKLLSRGRQFLSRPPVS